MRDRPWPVGVVPDVEEAARVAAVMGERCFGGHPIIIGAAWTRWACAPPSDRYPWATTSYALIERAEG